jgi:DNA-binding transcriptional MerR regulator
MPTADVRYSIDTLADLGGVSRRTVRFYVQEGLLPAPYGVGRGDHYGPEHLQALVRVRTLQEAGRSLDEIRQTRGTAARSAAPKTMAAPVAAERWRRIHLLPGVELHIAESRPLPNAAVLQRLIFWCRAALRPSPHEDGHANE